MLMRRISSRRGLTPVEKCRRKFLKYFPGGTEIWGALVIPGLVMVVIFLMPFIGQWRLGHRVPRRVRVPRSRVRLGRDLSGPYMKCVESVACEVD